MLGKMLRKVRNKEKMSLRKAATKLPFTHVYLWELEMERKPLSVTTFVKICKAYGYLVEVSAIKVQGKNEEVVSWII